MEKQQITIQRRELHRLLATTKHVVPTSSAIVPIFYNVMIEVKPSTQSITMHSSNLATYLQIDSNPQAICLKGAKALVGKYDSFRMCIPAKKLADLVAMLPDDELTLTYQEETFRLEIECMGNTYVFAGENPADWPKNNRPKNTTLAEVEMEIGEFFRGLEAVISVAGKDELRVAMTGVHCAMGGGKITLVTTDGNQLSRYVYYSDGAQIDITSLTPAKSLAAAMKIIDERLEKMKMTISQRWVKLEAGAVSIWMSQIDERFPDYENAISLESSHIKCRVKVADLRRAVQRIEIFKAPLGMLLSVGPDHCSVNAQNLDYGEEATEHIELVQYPTATCEIGLRVDQVRDYLSRAAQEEVWIHLHSRTRAAYFTPASPEGNEEAMWTTMPVMLLPAQYE